MNIKNPPFRFIIYSVAAAVATVILIWLGFMDLIKAELFIPFIAISFFLLLISQYLTSYLMEEFIMELKGNQHSKWLSAPLGIFFCFLTYSIITLSFGLLA